jgi:hypothetical protein
MRAGPARLVGGSLCGTVGLSGIVAVLAPQQSPLLGLVSVLAPSVADCSTAVVVTSKARHGGGEHQRSTVTEL